MSSPSCNQTSFISVGAHTPPATQVKPTLKVGDSVCFHRSFLVDIMLFVVLLEILVLGISFSAHWALEQHLVHNVRVLPELLWCTGIL